MPPAALLPGVRGGCCLLLVVPYGVDTLATETWDPPGFRDASREICFGKLREVAWTRASFACPLPSASRLAGASLAPCC